MMGVSVVDVMSMGGLKRITEFKVRKRRIETKGPSCEKCLCGGRWFPCQQSRDSG